MATKNIDIVVKAKDEASKAFESLSTKIQKNLKTIKIASWVVAGWLVALWKQFIDASIENEPLQRSFERLSESAWIASKDMLEAMRKASKGTVADTNLMAQANKAYALWIVKNTDDMATMIEIARLKWQAMWRTMEEALWDITTWLWRGSAQILDNLWIVVNAEEANQKYADSIGKTVDQLTDAEKKQALVNAVVSQGKKELEEAWEVQLTMQERLAKINTQWENTKNVIWDALIPVVEKLLTAITPVIEKVANWIEENPELTANLLIVAWAVAWLTFACTTILPVIWSVIAVLSWPAWWILALAWVVWWLKVLDSNLKTNQEKVAWYREEISRLTDDYNNGLIPQEEYTARVVELNAKIAECEANHRTFWWYLKDNFIQTLHEVMNPLDTMKQLNSDIEYRVNQAKLSFVNWAVSISKDVIPIIDKLIWYLKSAWDWLKKVASMLWSWVSSAADTVSWWVDSAKSLVWFANWWSVQGNVPIMVGERWPEVFVPNNSWRIIPNDELQWWTRINVNISWVSVRSDNDITALAQEMIRQIKLEKQFWIA